MVLELKPPEHPLWPTALNYVVSYYFIAIVASLDMESGAALRAGRISAFPSIWYWSTGAIFECLSDCAAAFGTRNPMLITSTRS